MSKILRNIAQVVLGTALAFAGFKHLTSSRLEFQAQVPSLLKSWADQVVIASGLVEISLALGLIAVWKYRVQIGALTAAFFTAIFWGNISQYVNHTDAFGLNSVTARFVRLLFQPLLLLWALWATGAWTTYRQSRR